MDAGTQTARPRAPVGPSHQGEALLEKTQMGRPLTEELWVRVSRSSWWAKLITSSREQAHAKGHNPPNVLFRPQIGL